MLFFTWDTRNQQLVKLCLAQVAKDIEDGESFLDHVMSRTDVNAFGSDPEQFIEKLAEEEVCIDDSW